MIFVLVAEVCLAQLCKSGVSAPLLPFLVAIKASKSLSTDAVILVIVQRNPLISTTKRNLLHASAGFTKLGLLIHPLGNAIQCRQGPNSNRIIKAIYISHKKNKAISSNVVLLLSSKRSSSHMSCSMLFFPDRGFYWEVLTHSLRCGSACQPRNAFTTAHHTP